MAPKVSAKDAEAQGMIWKAAVPVLKLMNEAAALAKKLATMPTRPSPSPRRP